MDTQIQAQSLLAIEQVLERVIAIEERLNQITGSKPSELWLPANEAVNHPLIKNQGIRHPQQLTRTGVRFGVFQLNKEYRIGVSATTFEFEVNRTASAIAKFCQMSDEQRRVKHGITRLSLNAQTKHAG
ncbi:MAG TPA: hypothetical protein V6C46_08090 [Coleofasciculaceae cyanobacterium]